LILPAYIRLGLKLLTMTSILAYSIGPVLMAMGKTNTAVLSLSHYVGCRYAQCRVTTVMNRSNPLSLPWKYNVHDEFNSLVVQ
jgi:hypothetical protein